MRGRSLLALTALVSTLVVAPLSTSASGATTITVTTTADGGPGSLRAAITQANITASAVIAFDIPGASPFVITPTTPLPALTRAGTVLDATTQPGYAAAPVVVLTGASLGSEPGLHLNADDLVVKGVTAVGFRGTGVLVSGARDRVEASWLGTGDGTTPQANGTGIILDGRDGRFSDNVISGNSGAGVLLRCATAHTVESNLIGITADGGGRLGNGGAGVAIGPGPGSCPSPDHVIKGNTISANAAGISNSSGSSLVIEANRVGTDPTGTLDLGNVGNGIDLGSGPNRVGGPTPAQANQLSGNGGWGIEVTGGATVQGNRVGTNAAGTSGVPNEAGGISVVNGSNVIAGNVASGHTGRVGIRVYGSSNTVTANRTGTNAAGTAALGNGTGIWVEGGALNVIGGAAPGAGNLASGNTDTGIAIYGRTSRVLGNTVGLDAAGVNPIPNTTGIDVAYADDGPTNIGEAGAGNIVSSNRDTGIHVRGCSGRASSINVVVRGNLVGTDATGLLPRGNAYGIYATTCVNGLTIGGAAPGAGNVVAATTTGAGIQVSTGIASTIQGNRIGTDRAGTVDLGNVGHGVLISAGEGQTATIGGTALGEGNVIAHNGGDGVALAAGVGHRVLGNSITDNDGIAVDLGDNGVTADAAEGGVNRSQNRPTIEAAATTEAATTVDLALSSLPSQTFRVEVFANAACDSAGPGEAGTLLGFGDITTDAAGTGTLSAVELAAAPQGTTSLSATATAPSGDTSEMGPCRAVTPPPPPTTTTTAPTPTTTTTAPPTTTSTTAPPGAPQRHLAVTMVGDGVVDGNGITCPGRCAVDLDEGTAVTLTATPAEGQRFVGWGGACTGTSTCALAMSTDREASAAFEASSPEPPPDVTVTVLLAGQGTIRSSDGVISCTTFPLCSGAVPSGSTVTLTATPFAGAAFDRWLSGCEGDPTSTTCVLHPTSATLVTARFGRPMTIITADGTVTGDGISCAASCSVVVGSSVQLTAAPDATHFFSQWQLSGTSSTCLGRRCTIDVPLVGVVSATALHLKGSVTVTQVGGTGAVASQPAGLSCASLRCSALFDRGSAEVVLTPGAPPPGSVFSSWTGCDTVAADHGCHLTFPTAADSARPVRTPTVQWAPAVTITARIGTTGGGTLTGPGGMSCPGTCTAVVPAGSTFRMVATPDAGKFLTRWSDSSVSQPTPCTTTTCDFKASSSAGSVMATFDSAQVAVSQMGGRTTVTSDPPGMTCPTTVVTCQHGFDAGLGEVLLTPGPAPAGTIFSAWTGCTSTDEGGSRCRLGLPAPTALAPLRTVQLKWVPAPTLTVVVGGAGTVRGGLSSSSSSIICPTKCSAALRASSTVVLTASPEQEAFMRSWTLVGATPRTSSTCRTTTCEFVLPASGLVTVTVLMTPGAVKVTQVGGTGSPTTVGGLTCQTSGVCTGSINRGPVEAVLQPGPAPAGTVFASWSGCTFVDDDDHDCHLAVPTASSALAPDLTVTLTWARPVTVYVTNVGIGGRIVGNNGIDCPGTCSAVVGAGSQVRLAATPGPTEFWSRWTIGGSTTTCMAPTCTFTAPSAAGVTAVPTFDRALVTVTQVGGVGTVLSESPGMNCLLASCTGRFDRGTAEVVLTPFAAPIGMTPSTWAGCTSVDADDHQCHITLPTGVADPAPVRAVSLTWATRVALTVDLGPGGGTVTGPGGISCGQTCFAWMPAYARVTLTQSPDATHYLAPWEPALGCAVGPTCTFALPGSGRRTVSLRFAQSTVTVNQPGSIGVVTFGDAGAHCQRVQCAESFDKGVTSTVVHILSPPTGQLFQSWTGCTTVDLDDHDCHLTLPASTATNVAPAVGLQLTFARPITVTSGITGPGQVGGTVPCATTSCSAAVAQGSTVALTAVPDDGWYFAGWTLTGLSQICPARSCTFTAPTSGTPTVTARFARAKVSVAQSGGTGTITSDPGGTTCSSLICTSSYDRGTEVVVRPSTPPSGRLFRSWTGCTSVDLDDHDCHVLLPSLPESSLPAIGLSLAWSAPVTITVSGTGGRVVGPAGIDCPGSCTAVVAGGSPVPLVATPGATTFFNGWAASGWTLPACSRQRSCELTAPLSTVAGASVTAVFSVGSVTVSQIGAIATLAVGTGTPCNSSLCVRPVTRDAADLVIRRTAPAGLTARGWTGCTTVDLDDGDCHVAVRTDVDAPPPAARVSVTWPSYVAVNVAVMTAGGIPVTDAAVALVTGGSFHCPNACTAAVVPSSTVNLYVSNSAVGGWRLAGVPLAACGSAPTCTFTAPTSGSAIVSIFLQ